MLVTSIFSISHNVFCPSNLKFKFLRSIILSYAPDFNLDMFHSLLFGKHLDKSQH